MSSEIEMNKKNLTLWPKKKRKEEFDTIKVSTSSNTKEEEDHAEGVIIDTPTTIISSCDSFTSTSTPSSLSSSSLVSPFSFTTSSRLSPSSGLSTLSSALTETSSYYFDLNSRWRVAFFNALEDDLYPTSPSFSNNKSSRSNNLGGGRVFSWRR